MNDSQESNGKSKSDEHCSATYSVFVMVEFRQHRYNKTGNPDERDYGKINIHEFEFAVKDIIKRRVATSDDQNSDSRIVETVKSIVSSFVETVKTMKRKGTAKTENCRKQKCIQRSRPDIRKNLSIFSTSEIASIKDENDH